jgi:hypothetical protein
MKEDPTRDPASEARDDWEQLCQPLTDEERRENARKIEALSVPDRFSLMFSTASEPRATPETDAMETVWSDLGVMAVPSGFARRLERQRDGLLEALQMMLGCELMGGDQRQGLGPDKPNTSPVARARAAIASVKGGQP